MVTQTKKKPAKKTVKKNKGGSKKGVKRGRYKKRVPIKAVDKNGGNQGKKKHVLKDEQIKQLRAAAAAGCTYVEMAAHIGVSRETLHKRREDQSGVQSAIDIGKAQGCIKAKNKLFKAWDDVSISNFKQVHLNALLYWLNNNTEFKTQLEVLDGQNVPKDIDINDDDAVAKYLESIKKPT